MPYCRSSTIFNCKYQCCDYRGNCPSCSANCQVYSSGNFNYFSSTNYCTTSSFSLPTAALANIIFWGSAAFIAGIVIITCYRIRKQRQQQEQQNIPQNYPQEEPNTIVEYRNQPQPSPGYNQQYNQPASYQGDPNLYNPNIGYQQPQPYQPYQPYNYQQPPQVQPIIINHQ